MSFSNKITLSNVIFILSLGVMFMILVVIFGKRQIARFKYKSRNIPHIDIGQGVPKALKFEIESRLRRVLQIRHQPKLVTPSILKSITKNYPNGCPYLYRMKALDETKALYDLFLLRHNVQYKPTTLLQEFLTYQILSLKLERGVVDTFVMSYNHARYGHAKFGADEFKDFMDHLQALILVISKAETTPQNTSVIYRGDGTSGPLKETTLSSLRS